MTGQTLGAKVSLLVSGLAVAACATANGPGKAPDVIVQHTLSALTSKESFSWEGEQGRIFVMRPLGTFRSGDTYCRDYEISQEGVLARPERQTACRIGERWVSVDPSTLGL